MEKVTTLANSDLVTTGRVPDRANQQSQESAWGISANGAQPAGMTRALGWLSLGLGLAQIIAPHKVAEMIGIERRDESIAMLRVVGAREIASGLGILTQANPAPWLWSRVGGDAMDLALLTSARSSPGSDQKRVAAATALVAGIAVIDTLSSKRQAAAADEPEQPSTESPEQGAIRVASAVTVQAPIESVFAAWEDFRGLPRFMSDAATVEVTGDRQSRWTVPAPAGQNVGWDVQITSSTPPERITWQTAKGSPISASGEIRFRQATGGRGTQVNFTATFDPPGGALGKTIAQPLAGIFGTKITNDLRRFKQLMELGEIVQSDDSIVPGPNPAQPRPNAAARAA